MQFGDSDFCFYYYVVGIDKVLQFAIPSFKEITKLKKQKKNGQTLARLPVFLKRNPFIERLISLLRVAK
jgi:hypothetical protein